MTDLLSKVVHVDIAAGRRRKLIRIIHQGTLWVSLIERIAFESTTISAAHLTWNISWINFAIMHPAVKECIALILLLLAVLLLLEHFLVSESLSILL